MTPFEQIFWTPAESLPDSDTTVLLHDPEQTEPVWPGYWDGASGRWLSADGMPADPTHWASMPGGPDR